MGYTAVAVESAAGGLPVPLHTHRANDVARYLIDAGLVPGLEGTTIAGREVTRGSSRFDFLLRRGAQEILLEVKSCTLFSNRVSMFPDAVTARGCRHLKELADLSHGPTRGAVLFLVNSPQVDCFLPEYHRDPLFAETLVGVKNRITIIPLSVGWNADLSLMRSMRVLPIPWRVLQREAHDSGCYMLILRLRAGVEVQVGGLGRLALSPGFYIYVGSARRGLRKRIDRHRRLRKKLWWHIDYLRAVADWHAVLPIATADDLECRLAAALRRFAGNDGIPRFGSSDCDCRSHLFFVALDPLQSRTFHHLCQELMMERLLLL